MHQPTVRLNKFIAIHYNSSRRHGDELIASGAVTVDGKPGRAGQQVSDAQTVAINGKLVAPRTDMVYLVLNKPVDYVCSRRQQGETPTIYWLLPKKFHHLKPVGRLDKDSSGLILLTNDGGFAHRMTHPKFAKEKVYEVEINKPLSELDFDKITKKGVDIGEDRLSKLQLAASEKQQAKSVEKLTAYRLLPDAIRWRATLAEGRNRQIRRTFEALGYHVTKLHRTQFGVFKLASLKPGLWQDVPKSHLL